MAFGSLLGFRNAATGFAESDNPNKNLYGTAGSWNNNADSVETLAANTYGYIERQASTDFSGASNLCMMGFTAAANPPATSWNTIGWALYQTNTTYEVRLGGSAVTSTTGSLGDTLRVQREVNGDMKFMKNGIAFYTITGATTGELKVDVAVANGNDAAKLISMERGNGPFTPNWTGKINMVEY